MYDVFIYPNADDTQPGYIIEYDPRAADSSPPASPTKHATPPLLSMLKRYILRSKVRVKDVSGDWDLWATWDTTSATPRPDEWKWGRSGAVEPVWTSTSHLPTLDAVLRSSLGPSGPRADADAGPPSPIWIWDRRAPGMGARVLLPKGSKRTSHRR